MGLSGRGGDWDLRSQVNKSAMGRGLCLCHRAEQDDGEDRPPNVVGSQP